MSTQADLPSDFNNDDKEFIFLLLDANLNSQILFALMYGIYTGILAITLWNIFRRAMVILIILLHTLTTIIFAVSWLDVHSGFTENGQSFWTLYLRLNTGIVQVVILKGVAASMSTILTDSYMIWCCWMVWARCWPVILLPILSLIFATVSKIITVYLTSVSLIEAADIFSTIYPICILATSLWCTFLITYRILTITGIKHRENGRLRVYQHFLGVLVESSALYSISLGVFLALTTSRNVCSKLLVYYLDIITAITRGVAPTLIIGCFAVGHRARLNGSWQGSVIGSASIRLQEEEHSRMSFREDDRTSSMLDGDLEAQRASSLREPSPTLRSVSVVTDYVHANTDVSPEASPHTRSRSLLHDRPSFSEDAAHDSTVADETTALDQ